MKTVNFWMGLGIGLLAGAAAGVYFSSTDEQKSGFQNKMNNVRDKIKETFNAGLETLEKAGDTLDHATRNAVLRAKAHRL
jgi:gas vesicle protein